ncbi:phosphorothioated DNA-binding restriction endonuclease [Candidatus Venteria ishoeyi]|uniref:Uncharacterized protein n=1 Tax=Candidatus Venteria ishoeyi TaxID=1899563 RepID=A0A1H6FBU6_9GAMM|nr:HNH endonuclease [Candidatus Venteria ishoeyi]MDM8545776.1 HNH endonuclease [Candidatus Venteria ishoeyi]SEH06871.1 Uncharacterised protein [Candidatus Venteria ishoeyi]
MTKNELKKLFSQLTIWKTGDKRAPHKPLLVLLAISHCLNKKIRLLPYKEIEKDFADLVQGFTPQRRAANLHYPFWRLKSDKIWVLENTEHVRSSSSGDAYVTDLRKFDVKGGFTTEIYDLIANDQSLVKEIVESLLKDTFPESIHEDILQAIGIDLELKTHKRDPKFRELILKAYEYRCAICGFDVKMGHTPIALEAAHIKWHMHKGPDIESNGLALCSLHHKLFDRGAFTLDDNQRIQVSDLANGTAGFQEWLMAYHGKTLIKPQHPDYIPHKEFVAWHVKEVFLGSSRYLPE